jgi:hypothetical protein
MDPAVNPFAALSLIVAPAVLTSASSLLAMSTSNRLARAIDRGKELARQLEETSDLSSPDSVRRLRELGTAEKRSLMILRALQSFYVAIGGFACATFVSLIGAILVPMAIGAVVRVVEGLALLVGLVAVAALVHGSVVLVHETRIVVKVLQERAAGIQRRADPSGRP